MNKKKTIPINLNKYIDSLSLESTNRKDIFKYINKNKVNKYYSLENGMIWLPTDTGTGMIGGNMGGAPIAIPMMGKMDGAYLNTKHYAENQALMKQVQDMLRVMYKFLNKNKMLSQDGIEEMKAGVDSESVLNEKSLTPAGNAFMKKYEYFLLNRCNAKTISAALEHCKQNEDILIGNYKGISYAGGANASDVRTLYSGLRKEAATFFKKNPGSLKQMTEFSFNWKKDKLHLQPLLDMMSSGNDIVIRRLRKISDTDFDIGIESAYILSALSNPHSVEFEYTAGRIVRCSISG